MGGENDVVPLQDLLRVCPLWPVVDENRKLLVAFLFDFNLPLLKKRHRCNDQSRFLRWIFRAITQNACDPACQLALQDLASKS